MVTVRVENLVQVGSRTGPGRVQVGSGGRAWDGSGTGLGRVGRVGSGSGPEYGPDPKISENFENLTPPRTPPRVFFGFFGSENPVSGPNSLKIGSGQTPP